MQIFVLQTAGGASPDGDAGGGTVQFVSLAEEWAAAGHEVHFITNASDRGLQGRNGGYSVHRIPSVASNGRPSALRFFLQALLNCWVQGRAVRGVVMAELKPPSVVIASSPYPSDVVAVLRLRRLGLAAAVYFHHLNPPPWWHPSRRGSPFRLLANWSFWTLGLAITKIAGFLPALDQPREMQGSGWVFPRVMPDPGFLTAEGEPPPRMEPPTYAACFVSRVAPNKGVVDLLRAWRRVVQVHPEAKLVIAGRCYYRGFEARLLRSIRRWGLDGRVEYRGFLPAEEKRDLLLRSQLFILPSYEEGWSLAVMEAAHYGTVPVVYDLPAYAYLGLEEVKVPVGDIGALAERIIGLLGDPHRRKAIAGALGANVRAYNRRAAAELQAHYLEDLARSSGLEQGGVARVSIRGRG